jgi:hypothetical protein
MQLVRLVRLQILCAVLVLPGTLAGTSPAAAAEQGKPESAAEKPAAAPAAVVYQPPRRGAPRARVGGGTRGPGGQDDLLTVLAPDHVGLTMQAQPTLYWYARTPAAARFRFALINDTEIEPLLEIDTGQDTVAGIQQLDLQDYDITLTPGVEYEWSVALVRDENNRSADIVTSGVIERVTPAAELVDRLAGSSGAERVRLYAAEGLWYDALDSLSGLIVAAPDDRALTAMRTALLEQIGLQEIAGLTGGGNGR